MTPNMWWGIGIAAVTAAALLVIAWIGGRYLGTPGDDDEQDGR